ncbi:MAG: hypothetical protein LBL35_00675 [Clostridiales bacterium]|jgi:chitinase|nr:hypothetical protein [Clostridiales bacterium]
MDKLFMFYMLKNALERNKTICNHENNGFDVDVLAGYWHEWAPIVPLDQTPMEYNIIIVSFMEGDPSGMPVYNPAAISGEELASSIARLRAQGRTALISMGGAHGDIRVPRDGKERLKAEIRRVIETYGFSGVDIDLEGESVTAADNPTVIPEALRELKTYFNDKNREFIITMAPEFIFLRGEDAAYKPYVTGLEGFYDLIFPQYYNQGQDGIFSDELGIYLSQNDDSRKCEFLYTLTKAIVTGSQSYIKIPADKFAIGLPATPDSALNGFVRNPEDAWNAVKRLSAEGENIRGFMTWSINRDSTTNYSFAKAYAPRNLRA